MIAAVKEKIEYQDWLLIIAVILAPMTELRIWKIGPAEALCLLWCMMQYRPMLLTRIKDPVVVFWFSFLCITLIGTCIGEWFYPAQSNIKEFLTWCYFAFVSLAAYSGLKERNIRQLISMLIKAACGTVVWYYMLYLYSIYVSVYFLGTHLWYGGDARFTGGASNPHQVALLLCVVTLILVCAAIEWTKGLQRCGMLLLAGMAVFLLVKTKSTTAIVAVLCGMAVVVVAFLMRTVFRNRWSRVLFLTVLFLGVVFYQDELFSRFWQWLSADSNGMGRLELFAQFPDAFWKSPIFGLGPGTHAGELEFHNTYLEVFAMSGLVGMAVFLWFSAAIFKKTYSVPCAVAIVTSLYVYGLAGFGMRRLIYWIMIGFVLCLAEKQKVNEQSRYRKI